MKYKLALATVFGFALIANNAYAEYPCQFYKKKVEYDDQGKAHTKWEPQGNAIHTDGHNSNLPSDVQCFGVCADKSCVCDEDEDNITKRSRNPFEKDEKFVHHDCRCDTVAPPAPSNNSLEAAETAEFEREL